MVLDNSICNRSDLTIQSFETLIDETTSAIHLGWGSSQLRHCQEHAPGTKFEPLVEVCTPNATLQLELCGIKLLDGESSPIQVEVFNLYDCRMSGLRCLLWDRQTQAFCFPVELRNTINTISMMSKAMATKLHVECEAPQFLSPAKLPIWGTGCYRHLGAWRAVRFVVGDGQQYGYHVTGLLDHGKKSTL